MKNQKWRYQIQKDSNGDQITYGYDGIPEHLSSMPSVECKRGKQAGTFARASFTPSRAPSRIATVG